MEHQAAAGGRPASTTLFLGPGAGLTRSAFIAKASADMDRGSAFETTTLEGSHLWIQTLFPLDRPSNAQPASPYLHGPIINGALQTSKQYETDRTTHYYGEFEAQLIARGIDVQACLTEHVNLYLQFLSTYHQQIFKVGRGDHNILRITRMLECVRVLEKSGPEGGYHQPLLQRICDFLQLFITEGRVDSTVVTEHWNVVLRRPIERTAATEDEFRALQFTLPPKIQPRSTPADRPVPAPAAAPAPIIDDQIPHLPPPPLPLPLPADPIAQPVTLPPPMQPALPFVESSARSEQATIGTPVTVLTPSATPAVRPPLFIPRLDLTRVSPSEEDPSNLTPRAPRASLPTASSPTPAVRLPPIPLQNPPVVQMPPERIPPLDLSRLPQPKKTPPVRASISPSSTPHLKPDRKQPPTTNTPQRMLTGALRNGALGLGTGLTLALLGALVLLAAAILGFISFGTLPLAIGIAVGGFLLTGALIGAFTGAAQGYQTAQTEQQQASAAKHLIAQSPDAHSASPDTTSRYSTRPLSSLRGKSAAASRTTGTDASDGLAVSKPTAGTKPPTRSAPT
jgi:hypothetical protein